MSTLLSDPATTTDATLVSRVRSGDDDAFALLVRRHQAPLVAYARQILGGSHHDAEECVQDAFVRALGFLRGRADRQIALKPWLYTIVRNAALDRLRVRGSHDTSALDGLQDVVSGGREDPHATVETRRRLNVVVDGLQRLPARQRRALVMLELEGRPHEEMARVLGVSVGATKALVCRARQGMAHLRSAA